MQGRYAEALNELQKARAFFGDDSTVWEHLGDTWLKLGNMDEASKHWKKALELDPESQRLIERLEANGVTTDEGPASEDNPADTMPRP
jgi:Flp pilus assembly protein TadD